MFFAVMFIIAGLLVAFVLPQYVTKGKKKKEKKQNTLLCKVIGWLLIFLGAYDALCTLFSF